MKETARQLWGKIEFVRAFSMLHLAKSSRVEALLHKLKYKNQLEIGVFLGKLYANKIRGFDAGQTYPFGGRCINHWDYDMRGSMSTN